MTGAERNAELENRISELETRVAKLEGTKGQGTQGKSNEIEALVELGRKLAREKDSQPEGIVPPAWKQAEQDPARSIR